MRLCQILCHEPALQTCNTILSPVPVSFQMSPSPEETRDSSIYTQSISSFLGTIMSFHFSAYLGSVSFTLFACMSFWFVISFFPVSSLKGCPTLLAIFPKNLPSLSCSPQLVLGHPVLHCFFPLPSMFPWLISYWTRGLFGFCFVLCCIVLFWRSLSRLTKIFFCDSGIRSIHNQVLSQSSLGQVYILLIFQ